MDLHSIPLLSRLRGALGYHVARSDTLAVNIANADTPGFVPRDIAGGDVASALSRPAAGVRLAATHAGHIASAPSRAARFDATASPDSETTLDGNAVVLEEQMARASEARMNYEAAISLYQKSLSFLRMAARAPGR